MKRFIFVCSVLLFPHAGYAESAIKDARGFITHDHALHCMQKQSDIHSSQQHLIEFENRKASLKSKIDYLHNEIRIRRQKIEELDQKNFQTNNKSYNQLIDQFESLSAERKQTINLYNTQNKQHVSHNAQDIILQNTYIEQCLNNTRINKKLHSEICQSSNNKWCMGFTF